jgi:hypothetical protein
MPSDSHEEKNSPPETRPPLSDGIAVTKLADLLKHTALDVPRNIWSDPERKPVRFREFLAVALAVILADVTIYHGAGFAGLALLVTGLSLLLLFGMTGVRYRPVTGLFGGLIILAAFKLFWCGFVSTFLCGLFVFAAFGLLLSGQPLWFWGVFAYLFQAVRSGGQGFADYAAAIRKQHGIPSKFQALSVIVPIFAVLVFGTIFVFANPDLCGQIREWLQNFFNNLWKNLSRFCPGFFEVCLWPATFWLMTGWLRPIRFMPLHARQDGTEYRKDETPRDIAAAGTVSSASSAGLNASSPKPETPSMEHPWFGTFRNTLLAVIVLFAVYLVFEFATLWFREFPKGFYYGGYAHRGAAWLTLALAVGTLILSAVFRGDMYRDKRIRFLRKLAGFWSVENILLAAAVYNRLEIYVRFNLNLTHKFFIFLKHCDIMNKNLGGRYVWRGKFQ